MFKKLSKLKIDDGGWANLLTVITCMIICSLIIYNLSSARASYICLDVKHKLDGIIRKNIINTIDLDDLREYKFGDGTVMISYDEESKTMSKNFDVTSPEYDSFKVKLAQKIKNEFISTTAGNIYDITYDTFDVKLNYQDIEYNGKQVYLPFISVKYVITFQTDILSGVPLIVNSFTLSDPEASGGKVTVTKDSNVDGAVNIAISGKTTVRYSIKAN
ncbi:hypothetical protein [Clostridium sp.]|uniref:hypothetical protein n=1 Tax=Clostridium sp. TaxID=1506 RepID=UPI001B7A56CC|nr:hypothetical protein [Clostridium sp.]MBP3916166.1 hypothetical protein [Clostridium sp.]